MIKMVKALKKNELSEDVLDSLMNVEEERYEKTELDVLKELFKLKEIESKTELTGKQVILMNQKRTIAKLLNWKTLEYCLDDFMILMVSKDRKGRLEFIDAFKSERDREEKSKDGFFSGFKDRLGL